MIEVQFYVKSREVTWTHRVFFLASIKNILTLNSLLYDLIR